MKCDELKAYSFYVTVDDDIELHNEAKSFYSKDDVDATIAELKAENRKLKRALWLSRAYRGYDNSILLPSKFMRKVWENVERKCRAKAKEYK